MGKMMQSESFEVLRTQEALGYVATTFSRTTLLTNNVNYIVVLVVSGHYSADYLHERVLHFIHYFNDTYLAKEVNEELFASFVGAAISDIKQAHLSLSDETEFLLNEIVGHTYFWNKVDEFEQILRGNDITLNGIREFYQNNMLGTNKKWLSLQMYSNKSRIFENDIIDFKYNLDNNTDLKHQFVVFDSPKDIQNVDNVAFFDVY